MLAYERRENLVHDHEARCRIYSYEFANLELRAKNNLLVTNWGKRLKQADRPGEEFQLCPSCGRHEPSRLTPKREQKWNEDHAKWCNHGVESFVLGYQFQADTLVLPVANAWIVGPDPEPFLRSLGSALVQGAVEHLELEQDEIAYFYQGSGDHGWNLAFYETVPGGAGYLEVLAGILPAWARQADALLFNHSCAGACYRCLKNYRNQVHHHLLDKNLVQDFLFHCANDELQGEPKDAVIGSAAKETSAQMELLRLDQAAMPRGPESPIEQLLLKAILDAGLPRPICQREFRDSVGNLITIADFAYEDQRIAIYCDGYAFHGTADKLAGDAMKRNSIQEQGWRVLTFWGRTIMAHTGRCVEQIARLMRVEGR